MTHKSNQIKCGHCAKRFTPERFWQRFCSPKCRRQWHWKRHQDAISLLEKSEEKRAST